MRVWDYRPDEVKYLLNPAFCGRVIYGTVSEYQRITKRFSIPAYLFGLAFGSTTADTNRDK